MAAPPPGWSRRGGGGQQQQQQYAVMAISQDVEAMTALQRVLPRELGLMGEIGQEMGSKVQSAKVGYLGMGVTSHTESDVTESDDVSL